MSEEIFRQKSLDKLKSPDNLDEYIKVSNPGIWLLISAVIILLVGACVWGIFGRLESTSDTYIYVTDGSATCSVVTEDILALKEGMLVRAEDFNATITSVSSENNQNCICTLSLDANVPSGVYEGQIVLESIQPLSFILN